MAEEDSSVKVEPAVPVAAGKEPKKRAAPREIPGNFPYTTTPGKFKETLGSIINAERPSKFSQDFMASILGVSGGSAAPIPSILKRIGFLSSDSSPSDLYSRFKSDSARSDAALEGLKNGFGEIFRKNEYAHRIPDEKLKDIIVEITGLVKADPIVGSIFGTFSAIRSFVDASKDEAPFGTVSHQKPESISDTESKSGSVSIRENSVGLIYNINIVLPNTDDPNVFNAIFRSLRENLIR